MRLDLLTHINSHSRLLFLHLTCYITPILSSASFSTLILDVSNLNNQLLSSFLSSYLVNDVLELHAYVCFGIRRHQRRTRTGAQGIHLVFISIWVEIRGSLHEGSEV